MMVVQVYQILMAESLWYHNTSLTEQALTIWTIEDRDLVPKFRQPKFD